MLSTLEDVSVMVYPQLLFSYKKKLPWTLLSAALRDGTVTKSHDSNRDGTDIYRHLLAKDTET